VKVSHLAAARSHKLPLPFGDLRPGAPLSAAADVALLGVAAVLTKDELPRPRAEQRPLVLRRIQ